VKVVDEDDLRGVGVVGVEDDGEGCDKDPVKIGGKEILSMLAGEP